MYIVTFENIVEETVSQEFTLKHVDEARNRAKEIIKSLMLAKYGKEW